jgi:ABC-type phosphate/phosphonate transport system substrate-binding protein
MLLALGSLQSEDRKPAEVRLCATHTLLRGGDPAAAEGALKVIATIVSAQTGVRVECSAISDGPALRKRMETGDVALGLLPGVELAWECKRNACFRPMLLTCNEKPALKAFLLVRASDPASSVAGLKDKRLSFPKLSFSHAYLFLDKAIRDAGYNPARFFSGCQVATNPDAAIEAVVEGEAEAVVVDEVALDVYRDRKPGRAKRLRVLAESTSFPCAAIVCTPEALKTEPVQRIREGLATAHERPAGRQMLSLMRLSSFMPVTPEYEKLLKDVLKEYPEPFEPVDFTKLTAKETTQQK